MRRQWFSFGQTAHQGHAGAGPAPSPRPGAGDHSPCPTPGPSAPPKGMCHRRGSLGRVGGPHGGELGCPGAPHFSHTLPSPRPGRDPSPGPSVCWANPQTPPKPGASSSPKRGWHRPLSTSNKDHRVTLLEHSRFPTHPGKGRPHASAHPTASSPMSRSTVSLGIHLLGWSPDLAPTPPGDAAGSPL